MNISIKKILLGSGMVLIVPAIMAALTVLVCIFCDEAEFLPGFLAVVVVGGGLGGGSLWIVRSQKIIFKYAETMTLAVLGWLLAGVLCALPFYLAALGLDGSEYAALTVFRDPNNCFFEAISGITSCGLSMVMDKVEQLPATFQFWRSLMQWIGGIGIVVHLSVFLKDELEALASNKKGESGGIIAGAAFDIRKVWWIYLIFTGIAYITFWWIADVSHWESLNHALTAVSTGGFTVRNESMEQYSGHQLMPVIPLMIIGALSFKRYRLWFTKGDWKGMLFYPPHIIFMVLLVLGSVAIGLTLDGDGAAKWEQAFFQFASALATCGFQSADIGSWGVMPLFIMIAAMMIGGMVISTVGGVKIDRLVKLFHLTKRPLNVRTASERKTLQTLKFFLLLWVGTIAISTLALLFLLDEPFTKLFFEVNSALSCVGLSAGITSADLGAAPKMVLSLTMLFGRLELMPLLLLLGRVPEEVE